MPLTTHTEKHFTASDTVRDIVIGMSDGLTVPFALAAGMSGAVSVTTLVVTAGLAEIAAGSISMGLGGYLAGKTDVEHYESERHREIHETEELPDLETKEVEDIFREYGLSDEQLEPVVTAICSDQDRWVDFMMRYELGLEKPKADRARKSAFTIAVAYIVGGFIPLAPYIFIRHDVRVALYVSVAVTLVALFVFGFIKGTFTGSRPFRSAFRTAVIGGVAAVVAFGIAKLIA
jgi:VIT1/CCC1 family predicted Fe2+/Mn2+ transporter